MAKKKKPVTPDPDSPTGTQEEEEFPEFKNDGIKTVKVMNLKEKIKLTLDQLKDLATMEVLLQVDVRMKKRLESIKKESSAEHFKINGHWKTNPPVMHIANLEGRKLNNNECEIRFGVFQTDEEGNKKAYEHFADVVLADGSKSRRLMSAEYRIAYEVVETIMFRKPITREITRILPKEEK